MTVASEPIRIVLVDDHPMVREGLRSMLSEDGIEVVGEAGCAEEAVRRCAELSPDIVLLDMQLPGGDGVQVLRELRKLRPDLAVLVVTMHDAPGFVRAAISAGAGGYVLKGVGRRELLTAIRAVRAGQVVLDPALVRAATTSPEAGLAPAGPVAERLNAVERDVVAHIAAGLTNREIADRMRWSVATAKKYVHRVLAKLGVSDRTEAAVVAVRQGLVD